MSEHPHEHIPLVEGDEEPDVEINPVEAEHDPDHVYEDPEVGDMQNLPPESFEADPDDDKGAEV